MIENQDGAFKICGRRRIKKILVGISSGVILIIFSTVAFSAKNGQISITTDKDQYEFSEVSNKMTVTIKNNSNQTVYFSDYSFEVMQVRDKDGWRSLPGAFHGKGPEITISLGANQTTRKEVFSPFMFSGIGYKFGTVSRIEVRVYRKCKTIGLGFGELSCVSSDTVYSNPFIVKNN